MKTYTEAYAEIMNDMQENAIEDITSFMYNQKYYSLPFNTFETNDRWIHKIIKTNEGQILLVVGDDPIQYDLTNVHIPDLFPLADYLNALTP